MSSEPFQTSGLEHRLWHGHGGCQHPLSGLAHFFPLCLIRFLDSQLNGMKPCQMILFTCSGASVRSTAQAAEQCLTSISPPGKVPTSDTCPSLFRDLCDQQMSGTYHLSVEFCLWYISSGCATLESVCNLSGWGKTISLSLNVTYLSVVLPQCRGRK